MAQIDLFNTGLPQTFDLLKKEKNCNLWNAKCNEMRYAYD